MGKHYSENSSNGNMAKFSLSYYTLGLFVSPDMFKMPLIVTNHSYKRIQVNQSGKTDNSVKSTFQQILTITHTNSPRNPGIKSIILNIQVLRC